MLFIWNRKTFFTGKSIKQFHVLTNLLDNCGIAYTYTITDPLTGRHRKTKNTSNVAFLSLYTIYVHRRDYDAASNLLHVIVEKKAE